MENAVDIVSDADGDVEVPERPYTLEELMKAQDFYVLPQVETEAVCG